MKEKKKLVYDKNKNPIYIPSSPVVHDEKWRKETSEHFRKRHGAWWIFAGLRGSQKRGWIDQYRKKARGK